MRFIDRQGEPQFFTDYKSKHPNDSYDDLKNNKEGADVREKLRDYNAEIQKGICAYCCCALEEGEIANEHIKPRNPNKGNGSYYRTWPKREDSMRYDNLIASCTSPDRCTSRKGNCFDERYFVSPLDANCATHFSFGPDGSIRGKTAEGAYTIKLLGLNSRKVTQARKAMLISYASIQSFEGAAACFLTDDGNGKLPSFFDILEFFGTEEDWSMLKSILFRHII